MPGGGTAVLASGMSKGRRSHMVGVLMASFAAFGGILYGYDTGIISGIKEMRFWLKTFGYYSESLEGYTISTANESLIVSILSVGTFFGALLAAPVGDLLGRRMGTIVACLTFSVGAAMQTAALEVPLFVVGRIFAGLGVGMVSCLVPMYQAECSPKWIRGAVVSCYQWAITIGLLLASFVNQFTKNRDDFGSFRIPIAIQFIWAGILSAGMFILPESPRYLAKCHRDTDASQSLHRLLNVPIDHPDIQAELDEIKENLRLEEELSTSTYSDCFKMGPNKILLRTLTGICLQGCQQLTGINFVFYYGTTFFANSGFSDPYIISIATNIVNVITTIPAFWAVDHVGRRRLLLIGAAAMSACEFLIAITGSTISVTNHTGQKVLVAFTCFYIAAFASTWGPVAWVVTSEIFPLTVRAKCMSMTTASNWLSNFAVGFSVPYMVNPEYGDLGPRVFFIWGSTCAGCFVFTYFFIPETKGLSLEQVDILYQNTTPIKSAAYRRRLMGYSPEEEIALMKNPKGKGKNVDEE